MLASLPLGENEHEPNRPHRRRRQRCQCVVRSRAVQRTATASHSPRAAPPTRTPDLPDAPRFACDAANPRTVSRLFEQLDTELPPLAVVLYNPSFRSRGPLVDLVADDVQRSLQVTAFGAFLVAQQAARRDAGRRAAARCSSPERRPASRAMRSRHRSRWASSRCADSRRALRASSRRRTSMSRTLSSTAQYAAAAIRRPCPTASSTRTRSRKACGNLVQQPRTAWSWEIEMRPWVEKF